MIYSYTVLFINISTRKKTKEKQKDLGFIKFGLLLLILLLLLLLIIIIMIIILMITILLVERNMLSHFNYLLYHKNYYYVVLYQSLYSLLYMYCAYFTMVSTYCVQAPSMRKMTRHTDIFPSQRHCTIEFNINMYYYIITPKAITTANWKHQFYS